MSDDKTKDQEEKGDVTLHGGKPVSLAQAEAEAEVGGPIDTKAVHKAKDKGDGAQAAPAHTLAATDCEEVTEDASVASVNAPPTVPVHAVPIFDSLKDANKAAAEEAEGSGVTPAAVMHVSPEGASTGVDPKDE